MTQLRQDFDPFSPLDTTIVVLGPENADAFRNYWKQNDLPFIGLPDPDHKVLNLYGQEVSLFKLGRMPAQVIVDRNGILRYAHFSNSMSDIPSNVEVLDCLRQIDQ